MSDRTWSSWAIAPLPVGIRAAAYMDPKGQARKPQRAGISCQAKGSTMSASPAMLRNPHPGEILLLDFLQPMRLSQSAMARAVGVPPRRINEIVLGKRAVTADTDL